MKKIVLFLIFSISLSALIIGCLAYSRVHPRKKLFGAGMEVCSGGVCYVDGSPVGDVQTCCCFADGTPCDKNDNPSACSHGCNDTDDPACSSSLCKPITPSKCDVYGHFEANCACAEDDGACKNRACGHYNQYTGGDYICCPSGDTHTWGLEDYCTNQPNGNKCHGDGVLMCQSGCCNDNDICADTSECSNYDPITSGCIANSQLIETKASGLIALKDLKPGDYVHNGEYYDLVYCIQEHEGEFEVLNIHLENNILKLTSEHLVYLDDKMVCTGSLNTGDIIQGQTIKNITKTVESVRNPVTISGKLLLGGVIVSCYNHSEEHAKKLQKLADCFDFEKLTEQIGSAMVQELVNTMYNKLANETFRIMKPLPQMVTV